MVRPYSSIVMCVLGARVMLETSVYTTAEEGDLNHVCNRESNPEKILFVPFTQQTDQHTYQGQ
uniref:Uncharacterized protein n=1 Tax=Picea glauca TaxID=3330 RepID=A0A101LZ02_PICGL|nr:hypothetical protein ABT39_MTgene4861 [Picea glauca]QHR88639.1 hypothetical protein Q903MT_gene2653 [Picea sitchensis]